MKVPRPSGTCADAEANDVLGCHGVDTFAAEGNFARGADQAADGAQRGGLAGAVGAQQRGDTTLAHREIDAVENSGLAIGGVQAFGLKQVGHARVSRVVPMRPQPPIRPPFR